jgi:hypothetical protein
MDPALEGSESQSDNLSNYIENSNEGNDVGGHSDEEEPATPGVSFVREANTSERDDGEYDDILNCADATETDSELVVKTVVTIENTERSTDDGEYDDILNCTEAATGRKSELNIETTETHVVKVEGETTGNFEKTENFVKDHDTGGGKESSTELDLERQALEAFYDVTSPQDEGDDTFEFEFQYRTKRPNARATPLGDVLEGSSEQDIPEDAHEQTPRCWSDICELPVATPPAHQTELSSTPSVQPITPPIISNSNPSKKAKSLPYKNALVDDKDCQVVVICGFAGSGKNALSETLVCNSPSIFTKVVQHTTRSALKHESPGRDFHFISIEKADKMVANEEMAEYTFLAPKEKKTKYNAAWLERKRCTMDESGQVEINTPSLPRSPTSLSADSEGTPLNKAVFYGTSFQSLMEAKMRGLPCAVMATSVEGAVQLQKKGLVALFILLHSGSEEPECELQPSATIDIRSDPYSALLQYASLYVRTTVPHNEAVYRSVEAQWNSVPEMPMDLNHSGVHNNKVNYTPFISLAQVLQHLQTMDMTEELKLIKPDVHYSGLKAVSHKMFGPPKITGRLLSRERDLVFAIAQLKLDTTDPIHNAALQTIFKRLTSGKETVDCPRFGPHWESIGFQGSDPRTDVRATGFLSIFHLLYLTDSKDRLEMATKIFSLSQSSEYPFPFCVLSINITRIALSALREGYLTKECRKEGAVINVVNRFYASALYHYYEEFRKKKLSFKDLGSVLANTETYCKKNVRQCLRALDGALLDFQGTRKGTQQIATGARGTSRASTPTGEDQVNFTDLAQVVDT